VAQAAEVSFRARDIQADRKSTMAHLGDPGDGREIGGIPDTLSSLSTFD